MEQSHLTLWSTIFPVKKPDSVITKRSLQKNFIIVTPFFRLIKFLNATQTPMPSTFHNKNAVRNAKYLTSLGLRKFSRCSYQGDDQEEKNDMKPTLFIRPFMKKFISEDKEGGK